MKIKCKGIIVKNGLALHGSWPKRVKHWQESFQSNEFNVKILVGHPDKPSSFTNGTDNIKYPRVKSSRRDGSLASANTKK